MSLIVSPGPAHYELTGGLGDAPAYSFGAKPEDKTGDEVPGPAAYDPASHHDSVSHTSPRYTMRPRTGDGKAASTTPGPGAYTPDSAYGKGPQLTMSPRHDEITTHAASDGVPGPGEYNTAREAGTEAPRYSMVGRPGSATEATPVPGPGAYAIGSTIGNARDPIQLRGRPSPARDEGVPAPGAYHTPARSSGPRYTMRPKPETMGSPDVPRTPGPGAYSVSGDLLGKSSKTLGGKAADSHLKDFVPGPGSYDGSPHTALGRSAPQYTMRPKHDPKSPWVATPGPGAYTPETKHGKGPVLTMSPKLTHEWKDGVPGPGAYSTRAEPGTSQPRYSLSGRPTGRDLSVPVPGPGAYSHTPSIGEGAPVTRDVIAPSFKSRHPPLEDKDHPGPGAYTPDAKKGAPAYTMRPKTSTGLPGMRTPGPGAYDHKSAVGGPLSKTMGARRGDGIEHAVPGPGAYEAHLSGVTGRTDATKGTAPAYSLTGRPGPTAKPSVPGPGAYTPPSHGASLPAAPRYSLYGRPKDPNGDNTPAASDYSPVHPGTSKAPAYSMLARRKESSQVLTPGPGEYTPPASRGLAASLSSRHVHSERFTTPGPGAYDSHLHHGGTHAPKHTMAPKHRTGSSLFASSTNPMNHMT